MALRRNEENDVNVVQTPYCVYIGVTIRGLIQYGDIFKGTIFDAREEKKEAISKYPLIASFIIPGDELAEKRILIDTPGNALYQKKQELIKSLTKKE